MSAITHTKQSGYAALDRLMEVLFRERPARTHRLDVRDLPDSLKRDIGIFDGR